MLWWHFTLMCIRWQWKEIVVLSVIVKFGFPKKTQNIRCHTKTQDFKNVLESIYMIICKELLPKKSHFFMMRSTCQQKHCARIPFTVYYWQPTNRYRASGIMSSRLFYMYSIETLLDNCGTEVKKSKNESYHIMTYKQIKFFIVLILDFL